MRGERFDGLPGYLPPACYQAESRQRDEGVSSPVGEPGIAGNDGLLAASCREIDLHGAPEFVGQWISGWGRSSKTGSSLPFTLGRTGSVIAFLVFPTSIHRIVTRSR